MNETEIENTGKKFKEACIKTANEFDKLALTLNELKHKKKLTHSSKFHK